MLVRQVIPETQDRIWPKETGFSEKRSSAVGVDPPEVRTRADFGDALGEAPLPRNDAALETPDDVDDVAEDADVVVADKSPAAEPLVNLIFFVKRYFSRCKASAW